MLLGFAKAHHQIPPDEKMGVALGYGSCPKLGASHLKSLQRLKLATSNSVHKYGLPMTTIKSHPEEKSGWSWARGAYKYFGVLL